MCICKHIYIYIYDNLKELLAEADLKDAFHVEPTVKFCDPTVYSNYCVIYYDII